jgi:hypothetical protein
MDARGRKISKTGEAGMTGGSSPKVVALLGVSGSGKSIVTRRLLAANFHRIRFGDAARDMLTAGFGCSPHEIDGDERNQAQARFGGHTVQSLMRSLTHDWGRGSIHSDIWVNEWRRRVDAVALRHPEPFILSDDLQRPNEAAAVRAVGGIVVRITRPGYSPASGAMLHRQAEISADIELLNDGPEKLAVITEQFLSGLDSALASIAA